MTRRAILRGLLLLAILADPVAGQPRDKFARVGYLSPTTLDLNSPNFIAFRRGLRELGWIEGKNLVLEYRGADNTPARLADLAAELVRLNVDAIVTSNSTVAVTVRKATTTIPIVVAAGSNQVELGLAESLARPGGNVTGFSFDVDMNSVSKGLELLKEAVPKARRVAVITNPASLGPALVTENARAAARSLGLPMHHVEVGRPGDLEGAFAEIVRERAGALLVAHDPLFYNNRGRLVELAAKHRLPAMYPGREFAAAGGLMSYGPDLRHHFHRTAVYVDISKHVGRVNRESIVVDAVAV